MEAEQCPSPITLRPISHDYQETMATGGIAYADYENIVVFSLQATP